MRTAFVTAAILAMVAASLPAQRRGDRDFGRSRDEWCRDTRATVCELREATLPNTSRITVDAHRNGGVAVRGWDRPDVQVRARIAVYGDSDSEARSVADEIKLVTTEGRIRAEGPPNGRRRWRDGGWSVSFELQVPRSAELTVDATNGRVSVEDVRGRMDVRTVNGGISLQDVSGDIRGTTTNGAIGVEVAGDKWDGPGLEVRTVNGAIHLALPPDVSADLEAHVSNGRIRVDYPLTVSGLIGGRREIRGTIGAGGPRIRASSTNGRITITRR